MKLTKVPATPHHPGHRFPVRPLAGIAAALLAVTLLAGCADEPDDDPCAGRQVVLNTADNTWYCQGDDGGPDLNFKLKGKPKFKPASPKKTATRTGK